MRTSQYKKHKENQGIINKEKATGKVEDNSKNIEEIKQLRNKAWAHLRIILKAHEGTRLRDLQSKVQDCLLIGDRDKAKAYSRLIDI